MNTAENEEVITGYCSWCQKEFPQNQLIFTHITTGKYPKAYRVCRKCYDFIAAQSEDI